MLTVCGFSSRVCSIHTRHLRDAITCRTPPPPLLQFNPYLPLPFFWCSNHNQDTDDGLDWQPRMSSSINRVHPDVEYLSTGDENFVKFEVHMHYAPPHPDQHPGRKPADTSSYMYSFEDFEPTDSYMFTHDDDDDDEVCKRTTKRHGPVGYYTFSGTSVHGRTCSSTSTVSYSSCECPLDGGGSYSIHPQLIHPYIVMWLRG